jgi:hypothetical protein
VRAAWGSGNRVADYPFDREFFRLVYPVDAAPKFVEAGFGHRVVDIGEGGFRYAHAEGVVPAAGTPVKGTLEFPEDDPLEVTGTVVRVQAGEVAVRCAPRAIPMGLVIREQRRVRRRYPFRT